MNHIRRRTTCHIPGHGTHCEVAHERPTRWPRPTEERIALQFELTADDPNPSGAYHQAPIK